MNKILQARPISTEPLPNNIALSPASFGHNDTSAQMLEQITEKNFKIAFPFVTIKVIKTQKIRTTCISFSTCFGTPSMWIYQSQK